MPQEKIKTTEDKGTENLQPDGPMDERDEVKQAEERTRQLQKKADADADSQNGDEASEA